MTNISIQKNNVKYSKGLFIVSGKSVKFDTSYSLKNEKTGKSVKFEFKESTGSEWDSNTIWIYKSSNGILLHLLNDDMTPQHAENYLRAKLRN